MPLDIAFTLSDRDLEKFKAIVVKARSTASNPRERQTSNKPHTKLSKLR